MFLTVEELSHRYDDCFIFESISFHINKTDLVAILGSSGSGKSTLLRILCGLEKPSGGVVLFNNKKISALPPTGEIVLVFQNYALWPHLTVLENVCLPLRTKKLKPKEILAKARSTLALLKISELEQKLPHQISGGQQQRVAIARALAYEPKFILFDEPFANLDTPLRRAAVMDIRNLLSSLGIGSILVSHNIEDAIEFADKFGALSNKKYYGFHDFLSFYEAPPTPEVAELFGEITYLSSGDSVYLTRPDFLNIAKDGPYKVKTIKRKQGSHQILATNGRLLTKITLRELPDWITVDSAISVTANKILFKL